MIDKKGVHAFIDEKLVIGFQELYPYMLSRFIKNCMELAVKDSKFFYEVTFNEKR